SRSPRAVAEREENSPQHRADAAHTPTPPRPTPFDQRLDEHYVAPYQPQRHPPGPGEIGPLHQHGRAGERRAEPEPGKPDVALMSDRPIHGGPRERQHEPDGELRPPPPACHDEPEQRRVP